MTWWETISGLSRSLLIMSLSGGVVALLLFVLKPIIRNRLPKSTQYYLWLVVIAAYLIPISSIVIIPGGNNGIPSISGVVREAVLTGYEYQEREIVRRTGHTGQLSGEQIARMDSEELAQTVSLLSETERTKNILNFILLQMPLVGLCCIMAVLIAEYLRFTAKLKKRNSIAKEMEHAILSELCGRKSVPFLYRNQLAATPMLFGVFRPAIILPDREYTDAQLRAVLLHELTHLRRKDILVKWLSVLACAVHWFNPIVWLVRREIDRACELACDEAVVNKLDADGRRNYGETLIYVAAESKIPHVVLSTTMCEEKKALKERLGAIPKSKKHTRLAIFVSAVLIIAAGAAAVALGASRADSSDEPPTITIKSSNYSIEWDVGLNRWNGYAYDRLSSFPDIMSRYRSVSNLPYVKNGEQIVFTFDGAAPDNMSLTEYILSQNGNEKYNLSGMEYDIRINGLNSRFNMFSTRGYYFSVKQNYTTAASSFSGDYEPGNTIKGYSLVCTWGENECEYTFIVRGDAAFTMTPIADTVSITIWKDDKGKTHFNLTDGELPPAPNQLWSGMVFDDIAGLNAALAEYQPETINTVLVKQTMDFTKEEIMELTGMLVIPSGNYSRATGVYGPPYKSFVEPFLDPPPSADVYNENTIPFGELRALAAKGDGLLMEDFVEYKGTDVGSGLYILQFTVEGGYTLLVGNGSTTGTPMYVLLLIPGYEAHIDIRNDDIDEFVRQYPVPNNTNHRIYQYLEVIMSSPTISSSSGDYIKTHQAEYDAILDMGIPALPTLTGILNGGDKGLRGVIAAQAVTDIMERKSNSTQSDWARAELQNAEHTVLRWSKGFDEPQTRDETPDAPLVEMLIENVTSSGLSFLFANKSDMEYLYGSDFALFVYKNNTWEAVEPIIENWGFNGEGYYILPHSTTDITAVDWRWLFGELPSGTYKIQKSMLFIRQPGDFDKYVLEKVFTLQ